MILDNLSPAKEDPILSLSVACRADPREHKIDLGVGVYRDDHGQTPIMSAIKKAERHLLEHQTTKGYVGLAGNEAFNSSMIDMLLGSGACAERSCAIQTPGASGALRMLADVIQISVPGGTVWLSDPSYANHAPIMQSAGLNVQYYRYFDVKTKQVNVEGMLEDLASAGADDVVLLHGCCHNPTGADISLADWQAITALAEKNGFLPFVDVAYQGFGSGLDEDVKGLRFLAERVESLVIASSCSKNFGLYRERTGVAVVMGKTAEKSSLIKSRLMECSRSSYTMPPDYGAALVEIILSQPALKKEWKNELSEMLQRVKTLRTGLSDALRVQFNDQRYDFIQHHRGMFSMIGVTPTQAKTLREKHAIYMVDSGRINVAGMQTENIETVAAALKSVCE